MLSAAFNPECKADFRLTLFPDRHARAAEEVCLTVFELAELIVSTSASAKERLPMLKMASFGDMPTEKGCLRHDRNILSLHGIEADYDGEDVCMDLAAQNLAQAGVQALLYTSPSHEPDKPRWRVLVPLGPRNTDVRYRLVSRLNGVLDGVLAPESWTLSTSYYFGAVAGNPPPEVIYVPGDGREFTFRSDLDEVGPPGASFVTHVRYGSGTRKTAEHWRWLQGDIHQGMKGGQPARNVAVASVAGLLLRRGVTGDDYRAALKDYNVRHCKPVLTDKTMSTIANSVLRTHARKAG